MSREDDRYEVPRTDEYATEATQKEHGFRRRVLRFFRKDKPIGVDGEVGSANIRATAERTTKEGREWNPNPSTKSQRQPSEAADSPDTARPSGVRDVEVKSSLTPRVILIPDDVRLKRGSQVGQPEGSTASKKDPSEVTAIAETHPAVPEAEGDGASSDPETAEPANHKLAEVVEPHQTVEDVRRLVEQARSRRETLAAEEIPDCPRCGSTMVLREARRGSYKGNVFWGCSTFPKCKGILNIPSSEASHWTRIWNSKQQ